MKVKKLIVDFDFGFKLFGLRSSAKEYKLAWSINKALSIDLQKKNELTMPFRGNITGKVSLYAYETDNSCITLARNRLIESSDPSVKFLLPELNHLDYIIRIDGDTYPNTPEKISETLKGLETVEYLAAFDINTIKSKNNLLFY